MKRILLLLSLFALPLQGALFFTPEMIAVHLKNYSEEEIRLLNKDLQVVRGVCLEDTHNTATRFYLASAGGPGARKTTILEKFVASHPEYQEGVYLDPDPRTLKFMVNTYYARSLNALKIAEEHDYSTVIKNAYDKWRAGSNYIVLTLLEEAYAAGRSIIYGTTSTGAHTPAYFQKLKENDYKIVLLLCSSSDEFRYDAVKYRNDVVRFYQSSPEDAVSKGTLFSVRMGDYFAHADELHFYWSDSLFAPERLAAVWSDGKLTIHDQEAMNRFIAKYEADRALLQTQGTALPAFSSFL